MQREQREALRLEVEQARGTTLGLPRACCYEQVDPEMRLVAAELEARWNGALERVRQLEARLTDFSACTGQAPQVDARALHARPRMCRPSGMTRRLFTSASQAAHRPHPHPRNHRGCR